MSAFPTRRKLGHTHRTLKRPAYQPNGQPDHSYKKVSNEDDFAALQFKLLVQVPFQAALFF